MKTSDYTTETLWEALLDARTKLAETRALLETATDAWLDGAQLWHDSKLYADYRQAALPKDWYAKARKAVERE